MANQDTYLLPSNSETGTKGTSLGYSQGFANVGNDVLEQLSCAFRFPSVTIPQGKNVVSATLHYFVSFKSASSGQLKFRAYGIKDANTADLSSDPFGRPHTTAVTTVTANDTDYSLNGYINIDVTSQVREVVNQGGWSSGNHMGFFLEDNASTSGVNVDDSHGQSILSVLQDALPDFTPGPYSVAAQKIPVSQNYGIKTTEKGYDAQNIIPGKIGYTSSSSVYKAIKDAEVGWPAGSNAQYVSHGLKYAPTFLTFFKKSGKVFSGCRSTNLSTDAASGVAALAVADTDKIGLLVTDSLNAPNSWYYYVFIDENL